MSTPGAGAEAPAAQGPPYAPRYQGLGETPSILPDIPVNAVFLALYVSAAAAHMTLFQINMHKRGKKFAFNAAIFGFCVTRIAATTLRIVWATQPHNVAVGMAAQICVYAGVIILFITNLLFAQRIVRAQHPRFGWSKPFSIALPIMFAIMVLTILALIAAVIVQFFVPTNWAAEWTRDIQLYGETLYAIAAFLPIPIILISTFVKSRPAYKDKGVDNFGSGSMTSKITIVLFTSFFLSLGAWYRAGTSFLPPIPIREATPWYFSKACFYIFNFTIEISVVLFYLFIRIDKRYIIPDGAKGPFSYGNGFVFAGETDKEGRTTINSTRNLTALSFRNSSATLPPPSRLSRTDSWGSYEGYMSTSTFKSAKKGHVSWGGRTEASEYTTTSVLDLQELPQIHPAEAFSFDFSRDIPDLDYPPEVKGAEHELGYNSKTGRWEQRNIMRDESRSNSRYRSRSSKTRSMMSSPAADQDVPPTPALPEGATLSSMLSASNSNRPESTGLNSLLSSGTFRNHERSESRMQTPGMDSSRMQSPGLDSMLNLRAFSPAPISEAGVSSLRSEERETGDGDVSSIHTRGE